MWQSGSDDFFTYLNPKLSKNFVHVHMVQRLNSQQAKWSKLPKKLSEIKDRVANLIMAPHTTGVNFIKLKSTG